jgi:hypothetical protein
MTTYDIIQLACGFRLLPPSLSERTHTHVGTQPYSRSKNTA